MSYITERRQLEEAQRRGPPRRLFFFGDARRTRQHRFHDSLGIGARAQNALAYGQLQRVKAPSAEDI